ncbi:MAG: hypothetical protein NVS3B2_13520 [Ramlibacter sp.]
MFLTTERGPQRQELAGPELEFAPQFGRNLERDRHRVGSLGTDAPDAQGKDVNGQPWSLKRA